MFLKKPNSWSIRLFLGCLLLLSFNLLAQENLSTPPTPVSAGEMAETEASARALGKQLDAASVRRSIELFLIVSEQWKRSGEFERSADCLREVSKIFNPLGESEKSIVYLNQARQLDRKYNKPAKSVATSALLAIANLRLGKIDEAEKFAANAAKISLATDEPDARATALYAQGLVNYENGKFNLATENFEQALNWWRKDNNSHGQVVALLELAYAYMTNDELVVALQKAEECLRIADENRDLQYQVFARNATAVMRSKLGNKQAALNIFLQSEKELPDGVNLLEKGDMYNHLAGIYYDLDELKLALNYRLKALDIFRRIKNPYAQLATLSKVGIITFKLGDETRGLEYFAEGFKIAREIRSDYFYSVFAQDLGNLYFERDKTEALRYYKLALPNFEKLRIRTHIGIIQSKIGSIYQAQGKLELAREQFEGALALNRETKNQFAESQNLYHLADLALLENKPAEAHELIRRSIEITERLSSEVLNSKLKSTYFSNVSNRYELYIRLLMKMSRDSADQNYALEALRAAEKSRARVMLENLSLAEAELTRDADAASVRREKEIRILLNAKADKLTDLLSRKADRAESERIGSEIGELEIELDNIKARLKEQSPVYSAIKNPAPFDVAEFQQNILDDRSMLVEFSFGEQESYLWTIEKHQTAAFVLPPRAEIEAKIEALRRLLQERGLKPDETVEDFQQRMRGAETAFATLSSELSRQLFGQIAGKLNDKRLIIVPDGALHYFPVAALPLPDSTDGEPILTSNETVYEPSAQTLTVLAKNRRLNAPARSLLVFSDPIFTSDDPRFSLPNQRLENPDTARQTGRLRFAESLDNLPRLAFSKDESDTIAATVGESNIETYSGFAATREKLLGLKTDEYKILHFATHGVTDEQRPELSGFVLSRFDEQGRKLDEFIRIHDIYGLELNADLVVLSACETGVGKELKGEGLKSLNNAFLQTGAKSVMSSLWKVEDGATLELMRNFYEALANERLTPSEALRRAQLSLRRNRSYSSPFYWAAFTVQGDFRSVPELSGSGKPGYRIYLPALLATLSLIGFYLCRRKIRASRK